MELLKAQHKAKYDVDINRKSHIKSSKNEEKESRKKPVPPSNGSLRADLATAKICGGPLEGILVDETLNKWVAQTKIDPTPLKEEINSNREI